MEHQGLACVCPLTHNAVVTITYPNGTVLKAVVLSHEDDEIRAIAAGSDDVLAFTRIRGAWMAEGGEPVTIEFEWQRRGAAPSCSEDDFICPKELAAGLITALRRGEERDEAVANTFFVLSPQGTRVAIQRTELQPN
jgi:hypothetical protein